MEKALAIIRSALEKHDGMDPDFPPRAFFTDYLPTAFNIRVIYWYNPPSYWDFLEMSEKVNLAIFRACEAPVGGQQTVSVIQHGGHDYDAIGKIPGSDWGCCLPVGGCRPRASGRSGGLSLLSGPTGRHLPTRGSRMALAASRL